SPITPSEQMEDPALKSLVSLLQTEAIADSAKAKQVAAAKGQFTIDANGLLCQRAIRFQQASASLEEVVRIVVPISRRFGLLKAYHTMPTYGHRGHQTLYDQLSKMYYWRGMYSDCVDFVGRCEVCAVRRPFRARYAHEVRVTRTPPRPFHSIALDIKGPLPTTTSNNSYILVVVCLLTRFIIAVPLPDVTGISIARALEDYVFSVHGSPYTMQVDNASYFKGEVMTKLATLHGTKHIAVLPYQPTSNGTCEAMVKRVSNQLYRHSNALRRWDKHLQPLVHGLNCVEVNHMGCSPFYALFGRDPVGLAELAWPDIERLDVDGNDFVSSLASRLREIWTNLKNDTDARKRELSAKANDAQSKTDPTPLVPGDYIWVEYGDDGHSRRLGKAGLPRRRRFKVLEYHPDRGYVKIDTDGLRIIDKVSVGRIMKAPREFTIRDEAAPLTKIERKGNADMQLPPGWQQIVRKGATKDYVEYLGPGGDGRAKSVVEAWRKFNSDPLLMPQPRITSAAPPATDGIRPSTTTTIVTPTTSEPVRLQLNAAKLNMTQVTSVCRTLMDMVIAGKKSQKMRQGLTLSVNLSDAGQTSWSVTNAQGQRATTAEEFAALIGRPLAELEVIPCDEYSSTPEVGSRVDVFWTDVAKWYPAVVMHKCKQYGNLLHLVRYDNEKTMYWHDLNDPDNRWRQSTTHGTSLAHVMFADVLANTIHTRMMRRQQQLRNQRLSLVNLVTFDREAPCIELALKGRGVAPCAVEYDGPPTAAGSQRLIMSPHDAGHDGPPWLGCPKCRQDTLKLLQPGVAVCADCTNFFRCDRGGGHISPASFRQEITP
ncbi:MAG: DDE-type integrase/transposase/recombinase, partial [Gammaproteobacteria bacterium]|nr:DDE-type integrase/transposase/recombinase [Gammaproteobacteria bacterium]